MALPDLTDVAGRLLQSLGGRRFGVATIHRRENRGERLAGIATGLGRVSRDFDLPLILPPHPAPERSEEHTSELPSLMRTSYAVFSLKKKTTTQIPRTKY